VAGDDELPDPLPLASPAEIEDLFARTVGMLGFPGHDTVSWPGLGKQAQATYRQGVISRATDFFNDAGAASPDRQYLQHNMQSWGGFSGSPIFLANGHVAALHNAGATIQNDSGRIASLQYGVRVDCLWELAAHHKLTDQINVPVPIDDLRLNRFDGEDPRLAELRRVRALVSEGNVLYQQHKFAEAGKLFNDAIALMPNYAPAHDAKAVNHTDYAFHVLGGREKARRTGRYQENIDQCALALKHIKIALQLDPNNLSYMLSYAINQRNYDYARQPGNNTVDSPRGREIANRVLERPGLDPETAAYAYSTYANSFPLSEQGLPWHTKAVEACPWEDFALENRAARYEELGRHSLAAADRRRAKELRAAETANLKAWRLATSQDESVRNPAESLRMAEEANRLFHYKYWDALDTLAYAHAAAGNYDQAVHWVTEAQKIAPEEEKSYLARQLRRYRDKAAAEQ
jgi:tetratricopeptide (TPR) repeat protein